jgi:hypothetical protein
MVNESLGVCKLKLFGQNRDYQRNGVKRANNQEAPFKTDPPNLRFNLTVKRFI